MHAATGTGKTLAAWLGPVAEWIAERQERQEPRTENREPRTENREQTTGQLRVIWLTPLRALAADTLAALRGPLDELQVPWILETRTGDTAAATRVRQRKRLPNALVTTPESLTLLLAREDAAEIFGELRAVIVDEWHELMATKRGVQTELALARLRNFAPALRTWGLSATLGNLDVALQALTGCTAENAEEFRVGSAARATLLAAKPARLIRGLVPKTLQIDALLPAEIERFPWAGHLGLKMLPQVVAAIEEGTSALIFTNTRAQTELWYQAILEARPEWAGEIALHHGSLGRDVRDWVEQALKDGTVRCVVCTSSLDLGVDFAPVDRVLQIGSPKGVARLLQRAGRSGHAPGRPSRVSCVPTNAFELIEIAAVRRAVAAGQIEARPPIERPLDVLVQHLVTCALGGGFAASQLLAEVRSTYAYRSLPDDEWQWALDFVTSGGAALQNYPEYHRVIERDGRYVVEDKQIARRHRMSIGTIVGEAALTVQFLRGGRLGTVEESFAARLKRGDRFVFAGRTLEFVRLREMTVWVRLAASAKGTVPRWAGSRMPLSTELASAVRATLEQAADGVFDEPELEALRPILAIQQRWSTIPRSGELLIERLRTREGQHLFFYPFEGRSVHEGLAALFAYRLARLQPISFTIAVNDYGFELLSPDLAPLESLIRRPSDDQPRLADTGLLTTDNLAADITASLNATEMARRQFREIARVAGLVHQGFPGEKNAKQLQASSGLIYDVFQQYDPANRLLDQAHREVLDRQLEQSRLAQALARLSSATLRLTEIARPTPFAFPLVVDRLRETLTSEKLADRVK
ncbi:MAG: ligase-associated DNA damage response DEXH box helicase, partial [Roseiflexaceae bacterium]|nr:ligase-associated DNA damage response DEXH box helicase [Roseiflexaceae bacterium]